MGLRADLTVRERTAIALSLGIGAAGIWMIRLAIIVPEPTSKLGMLIVSGVVCILGAGCYAIYALTNKRPPSVRASKDGAKIVWARFTDRTRTPRAAPFA